MIKLQSNATYVFRCCGEMVLPGVNFIKSQDFLNHPSVKSRLEQGVFIVKDEVKPAQKVGKEINILDYFMGLNVRDFTAEIKSIFNVQLLEEILKRDERLSVKKACEDQLKKIKGSDDAND
jgi:hypothetical protein